ncbi:MAG: tetratricopeptide repeat protein [Magnetococcales bacterium]|nr:tetratricopeptide repeat protein [Magnetococcales bacterium]
MLPCSIKSILSTTLVLLLLTVPTAKAIGDTAKISWQPFIDASWGSTTPSQFRNSGKLFDEIVKSGKKLPHNNLKFIWGLDRVANFYNKAGDIKKEEAFISHSLKLQEKKFGKDNPLLASHLQKLAKIWQKQLKHKRAEKALERALKLIENSYGKNHILTINILKELVKIKEKNGQTKQAQLLNQRVLRQLTIAIPATSTAVAIINNKEAQLIKVEDNKNRQVELQQKALKLYMNNRGPYHLARINLLLSLADSSQRNGKYEETIEYLKSALAISENLKGADHHDLVAILLQTAKNYQFLNKPNLAQPFLQRSLLLEEKKHKNSPDHHEIAVIIYSLANNYRKNKQPEQAIALYNRTLALQQQNSQSSKLIAKTLNGLAQTLQAKGNIIMAEDTNRQALEMFVKIEGAGTPMATTALKYHRELIKELTQKIQPGFIIPTKFREQIRLLQTRLKALKINPGPIDGYTGPRTKKAINIFNSRIGLLPQDKGKEIPLTEVIAHIPPIIN